MKTDELNKVIEAAEQGDPDAQYNLALMYYRGLGVEKNYKAALMWFSIATQRENADAQFNLGIMYENGHGVQTDYVRAYMWYKLANNHHSGLDENYRLYINREITNLSLKMTLAQLKKAEGIFFSFF